MKVSTILDQIDIESIALPVFQNKGVKSTNDV